MDILIGRNGKILDVNGVADTHISYVQLDLLNESRRQRPVGDFFQMLLQNAFRYLFMVAQNDLRYGFYHLILYQYLEIHFQDLPL